VTEQQPQTTPSTCPSCGASVRADVPWCTQCYASLLPEQGGGPGAAPDAGPAVQHTGEPAVEPAVQPTGEPAVERDVERDVEHGAEPDIGRDEAGALSGVEPPAGRAGPQSQEPSPDVDRLADQMLARLAAERDEVQGLASRLPSSPGGRTVLVAVALVGLMALALLVMFVLGSLF
jgi:hypothetical protein